MDAITHVVENKNNHVLEGRRGNNLGVSWNTKITMSWRGVVGHHWGVSWNTKITMSWMHVVDTTSMSWIHVVDTDNMS